MKSKDLTKLASTLEDLGWRVRITNNGHAYSAWPPGADHPISFSTLSDARDFGQIKATLAKHGVVLDPPPRKETRMPRTAPPRKTQREVIAKATGIGKAQREPRASKPIADNWRDASHHILSDHLLERMTERNIGMYEVYSAIASPDSSRSDGDGGRSYQRGDVKVAVAQDGTIKTVMDVDSDLRTTPRKVQLPSPRQLNGGASANGRQKGTVGDAYDIAWLMVPHDSPETVEMMITPAIAEKILTLNVHNRPLRRPDVDRWRAVIDPPDGSPSGWLMTHQGVAIDSLGRLQDGQHRLTAVAEGNVAVRMLVSVGMPPEAFDVIDTGRTRSYGDVLAMRGVHRASHVGAMLRMVWSYQHDLILRGGIKVPNSHVVTLYENNREAVDEALHLASQLRNQCKIRLSAAAAGIFLIRQSYRGKLWDEFFDGLIEGVSTSRVIKAGHLAREDPRNAFVRLMLNWANEGGSRRAQEVLAVFLKAWAAFCQDKPVKYFTFRSDEAMPIVFVPPGS